MTDSSRTALKLWVAIVASGLWMGAAGVALIGWVISRMRDK